MRKVTQEVVGAFNHAQPRKQSNTVSTGNELYLHGNKIAEYRDGDLWITNAGGQNNTTKERLNGLQGVSIYQKAGQWYLNGKLWDGRWINVRTSVVEQDDVKPFRSVALVALMGELFGSTQKEKNDWKARMLKAGISGLSMPEDWDQLDEQEKERRLNAVIAFAKK